MTVCRTLLLALLIVATPLCGSAQFGGMPGMPGIPGGMPRDFGAPPPQAGPPPACRELMSLRDETQKHGMAIQKANERRGSVQDACRLFRTYLAAEAKFIKGLEDNSRTCGVPPDAIRQAKEGHAKAGQIGKQVCEAAAQGPRPTGPLLWDDLLADAEKPRTGSRPMRRDPWDALREGSQKQSQSEDDNCNICWNTGDFGLPGDRMPGR